MRILIGLVEFFFRPFDYKLEKSCVKQLLTELSPIDCANTQVSILQYGANDQIIHKFSDAQEIDVIIPKVRSFFFVLNPGN